MNYIMNITKAIFVVTFLLILYLNGHAQNSAGPEKKYNYLLYKPENYSASDKGYPLVIYLHGASCRGHDINKIKVYGLPYLIDHGYTYDFIIASPQCPPDKSWISDNWFEPFYKEIISKYRIDTNRIYLTGISLGGYGTWQLAMKYPDKFAAVVPMCGGYYNYKEICKIKDIPVWAFHGAKDNIVDISETERLVEELRKCSGDIKYTRLKDKGHDLTYLFKDQEIYKWMLKHKKE
jgi:predicted peptidase